MLNLKILMADDETEILEIMAKKIAIAGYQVITAQDGQEAWEKIQSELPDVILLDLAMPKMSGFDVLRELRAHPPTEKWQPVIIISAKGELADIQKGLSLDAEHYIMKPCSVDEVLKAIRIVVSLIPQRKSVSEIQENTE